MCFRIFFASEKPHRHFSTQKNLPNCLAGAVKGELAPEAQAALAALPPAERLLVDIQAAFEAANVALSEYTNLGPKELAGLLSPSLVARSARLLLEEKKDQWARRRVETHRVDYL